jgi:membrane protein implicated in regulation of membrane protease activity
MSRKKLSRRAVLGPWLAPAVLVAELAALPLCVTGIVLEADRLSLLALLALAFANLLELVEWRRVAQAYHAEERTVRGAYALIGLARQVIEPEDGGAVVVHPIPILQQAQQQLDMRDRALALERLEEPDRG